MEIHDVVNIDLLKPYHELTLETKIMTCHLADIVPHFQLSLITNQVFGMKTH
jgi:hypothetical protein